MTSLGSVRARTTMSACAAVGLVLVIASAGLLFVLRRSLVANIDSGTAARAADIHAQAALGPLPPVLAVRGSEESLVQVVDGTGAVVASSPNLATREPITRLRPGPGRRASVATLPRVPLGDRDEEFRVAALAAGSPGGPLTIYVASSLEPVGDSVETVRTTLIVGVPLLLGLLGLTTWLVVGRALRPVEDIRAEVADISASALDRRVPEPGVDDEIGRLARTMNAMLSRLESSAEQQRRFVGDASHELQSPLAATRTELEVALAHPDITDWTITATGLLDENERMARLVQDLLFLAGVEEDTLARRPALQVDLDDVVLAEVNRSRHRHVAVDVSAVSAAAVRGRADDLGRVVRNLVENAQRHARTKVAVALRSDGEYAELVVTDDGDGIPAADRERVFDRFTRLDDSRFRDGGGSGLGLAIVREVVVSHGGTVTVDDAGPGARVVVRIPSSV